MGTTVRRLLLVQTATTLSKALRFPEETENMGPKEASYSGLKKKKKKIPNYPAAETHRSADEDPGVHGIKLELEGNPQLVYSLYS